MSVADGKILRYMPTVSLCEEVTLEDRAPDHGAEERAGGGGGYSTGATNAVFIISIYYTNFVFLLENCPSETTGKLKVTLRKTFHIEN
jgi:hypothetical protein